MRKIFASLFMIAAVVGIGVFATGAYFTDTVTQSNLTFRTSNADLKLGFCFGLSTDCSSAVADKDNFDYVGIDVKVGPGIANSDCFVLENKSSYAMSLTGGIASYTQSPSGTTTTDSMDRAFLVKAETSDSSCNPGSGSVKFTQQSLHSAYGAGVGVGFGSLAPGGRLYVIWSNAWDSTGDQTALQGGWILANAVMTGTTP